MWECLIWLILWLIWLDSISEYGSAGENTIYVLSFQCVRDPCACLFLFRCCLLVGRAGSMSCGLQNTSISIFCCMYRLWLIYLFIYRKLLGMMTLAGNSTAGCIGECYIMLFDVDNLVFSGDAFQCWDACFEICSWENLALHRYISLFRLLELVSFPTSKCNWLCSLFYKKSWHFGDVVLSFETGHVLYVFMWCNWIADCLC